MFTNINISYLDNNFNYIIEYQKNESLSSGVVYMDHIMDESGYEDLYNDIYLWNPNEESYISRYNNQWVKNKCDIYNEYIPTTYKTSTITIHFPCYSIDTYMKGVKYALNICVWIGNKKVNIISKIISRGQCLANTRLKTFYNQSYYESIQFNTIDIYEMMFSDEWADFRKEVCGYNNICSNASIYISLHPVYMLNDIYYKMDDCVGGQNTMVITKDPNKQLRLTLSSNINQPLKTNLPAFNCELKCDIPIDKYLKTVYNINDYKFIYKLVIGNEDELYIMLNSDEVDVTVYTFDRSLIRETDNFSNMIGWKSGIFVIASVDILYDNNNMSLMSNKILLSEDVMRFFVGDGFKTSKNRNVNYINLDNINMNVLNINTINKIENKIVQFSNQTNDKSNIIQPVFFRSATLADIVVHPEVVETICINLDQYKSKVDSFVIQIEGVKFIEIGRTAAGSLFKIQGKLLPREVSSGVYYILNQDDELITTGKYNYEV